MIDPLVRPADAADVDALRQLEAEARAALPAVRGGVRWLEEHAEIGPSWRTTIDTDEVFVAELEGGLVVGYLVLSTSDDVATVVQVFVMPAARELGFGDGLLEAAADRARTNGARLLEGYALPGDRDTKNLYERAGITARLITVSRPLIGAPSSRRTTSSSSPSSEHQ